MRVHRPLLLIQVAGRIWYTWYIWSGTSSGCNNRTSVTGPEVQGGGREGAERGPGKIGEKRKRKKRKERKKRGKGKEGKKKIKGEKKEEKKERKKRKKRKLKKEKGEESFL